VNVDNAPNVPRNVPNGFGGDSRISPHLQQIRTAILENLVGNDGIVRSDNGRGGGIDAVLAVTPPGAVNDMYFSLSDACSYEMSVERVFEWLDRCP
jgi:hypothetical protein